MRINQNIYALYQGEHNLTDGTIREIAKNQGVKLDSVKFLLTPSYRKRVNSNKLAHTVSAGMIGL